MVVPPTVPMTKTELRRTIRAARRRFVVSLNEDPGVLADGDGIRRAVHEMRLAEVNFPRIETGVTVGSYAARGDEIDPRFVEAGLKSTGRPIAFPIAEGDRLTFHLCDYAALLPGYRGILEPPANAPQVTPAVILVPLVAADLRGNRIGQGGGHYDRTLAALRANRPVIAIGLAWEVQIVAAIPADLWDQPLDWLATPERLVDCRSFQTRMP